MTARMKLGMFDPDEKVAYAQIPFSVNDNPAHDQLSRVAAQKSIVLLKNANHLLPLQKNLKKLRGRTLVERPRPGFLLAGREERAQAEQVVRRAHHPEQGALAEPETFEHLGPFGRIGDRRCLGLELDAHADHLDVVAGVVELGLDPGGRRRNIVEGVLADVDDGQHPTVREQEVRSQESADDPL